MIASRKLALPPREIGQKVSGLDINRTKSNLFIVGLSQADSDHLAIATGIALGSFPFRYVGVPIMTDRIRATFYRPLVDKVAGCIARWTANSISYAGRLELVRAVLQGVVCFWLNMLPTPIVIVSQINCLVRRFLWNSQHSLVGWQQICLPKNRGGRGHQGAVSMEFSPFGTGALGHSS